MADPKKGTGKKPKGSGRRLYTDENPKDTVRIKFATIKDARATVRKVKRVRKSYARKIQILTVGEQRARVMGKSEAAAVYRSFINMMKRKTKKMNEAAYAGNLGFEELVKFHSKATPQQKKELSSHIKNKKHNEFRDLIHNVTGVKLHKSVNEDCSPYNEWTYAEPVKY